MKDLKNPIKELNHLQKQNDEFNSSLSKAKDEATKEFKTSSKFTNLLDNNYVVGFKDFRLDTTEAFPWWTLILLRSPLQLRVLCSKPTQRM